jgi:hypothetical protein
MTGLPAAALAPSQTYEIAGGGENIPQFEGFRADVKFLRFPEIDVAGTRSSRFHADLRVAEQQGRTRYARGNGTSSDG